MKRFKLDDYLEAPSGSYPKKQLKRLSKVPKTKKRKYIGGRGSDIKFAITEMIVAVEDEYAIQEIADIIFDAVEGACLETEDHSEEIFEEDRDFITEELMDALFKKFKNAGGWL